MEDLIWREFLMKCTDQIMKYYILTKQSPIVGHDFKNIEPTSILLLL